MMHQTRQLAAIMFTDIVGYTALMGRDEKHAFEILSINRNIHHTHIARYHGRMIKELGDGVLASFQTVTDAVFCAAAIHQSANKVEGLKLRIGIHLGEVVFENNDVFGDGVNIASRLQALASIGSTWVSESVYKNLINKKEIKSEFVREEHLKNVNEPVKVYDVQVKEIPGYLTDHIDSFKGQNISKNVKNKKFLYFAIPMLLLILAALYYVYYPKSELENPAVSSPRQNSIAVIPFKNMSNKQENLYFCDGVMESILSHLSKLKGLHVISRTSMEQYRDTKKTIPKIAGELDVAYILEGSVQRDGNKLKVTAQLIEAASDKHIWSEEYLRDEADIFKLQSNIAMEIASALQISLDAQEKEQIERIPTANLEAWNAYLHAQRKYTEWVYSNRDRKSLMEVIELCNKAISFDSGLAEAYNLKANAYYNANYLREFYQDNFMDSLYFWCSKSLELDPTSPMTYMLLGYYYNNTGQRDKAKTHFEKAIQYGPSEMQAYWGLSDYYASQKQIEERFINLRKSLSLAPKSIWLPLLYQHFAMFYIDICDFENALYYAEKSLELEPSLEVISPKMWIYTVMGEGQKAKEFALKLCQRDSLIGLDFLLTYYFTYEPQNALPYFQRYFELKKDTILLPGHMHRLAHSLWLTGRKVEAMRKFREAENANLKSISLGRGEISAFYDLAGINCFFGRKEKALEFLRKYSDGGWEGGLPYYIDHDPMFNNLRSDKEFRNIVSHAKAETVKQRELIYALENKSK